LANSLPAKSKALIGALAATGGVTPLNRPLKPSFLMVVFATDIADCFVSATCYLVLIVSKG